MLLKQTRSLIAEVPISAAT